MNRGIFILAGRIKALCIGGTGSGTGKTTLTLALLAALRRRGLVVQPFKIGPDFIDPGHHHAASGRSSHNLDTWMLRPEENQAIFQHYAAEADIAVVEGVMGIFDGLGPQDETGSTAHLAKLLGIPVLLAIHAKGMARSIAALASGFQNFDPGLIWAGAIANKCGSAGHIEILRQSMAGNGTMPLLGGLLRDDDISLPERHLGLITADEGRLNEDALERLADLAEQGLDLDRLLNDLPSLEAMPVDDDALKQADVRIGVARDQAFCFYYQENLRRLRAAGAELVFFSPLRDKCLPAGLDGLYLGGGYPELFAKELSQNQSMLADIAVSAEYGMSVFAECGGMIYLGRSVTDLEGRKWPLCGVLPIETGMNRKLRKLAYREAVFTGGTPLGPKGTKARGHEFHYSEISADHGGAINGVFHLRGRGNGGDADLGPAGFRVANTVASYMHFHFGSNHQLANNFVDFCRSAA
jgi:cobyrinic acid a,c-diamide synthase